MTMKSVLKRPVYVAPSQDDVEVQRWGVTPYASNCMRVSIFYGKCSGSPTIELQQSQSYGLWTDVKSTTVSASTDKTITFSASSATISSASHGFADGDWVTFFSTDVLPAPFEQGIPYFVMNATMNNFSVRLQESPSSPALVAVAAGSGSYSAAAIQEAGDLTVQAVNSSDQAVTPLKGGVRLQVTTDGSADIQIVQVQSTF